VAVAARAIRDLVVLRRQADNDNKSLATLTLESKIRFRSPADRAESLGGNRHGYGRRHVVRS
jgi:hypothetical protein